MATPKPSRTRRQPSPKTPSKAQIRQQLKQQALKDSGFKPQQQQQPPAAPQQKQKPLTKAPSSGRKPQNRKPPKR